MRGMCCDECDECANSLVVNENQIRANLNKSVSSAFYYISELANKQLVNENQIRANHKKSASSVFYKNLKVIVCLP